jgi:hypothetical protein
VQLPPSGDVGEHLWVALKRADMQIREKYRRGGEEMHEVLAPTLSVVFRLIAPQDRGEWKRQRLGPRFHPVALDHQPQGALDAFCLERLVPQLPFQPMYGLSKLGQLPAYSDSCMLLLELRWKEGFPRPEASQ